MFQVRSWGYRSFSLSPLTSPAAGFSFSKCSALLLFPFSGLRSLVASKLRCGGAGPHSGGHYAHDCPHASSMAGTEAERRERFRAKEGAAEGPGTLEESAARYRAVNRTLRQKQARAAKAAKEEAKAQQQLARRNARRQRGRERQKVRKQELQKGWNAKRKPAAKRKPSGTAKR